jgi:hypothetical protein
MSLIATLEAMYEAGASAEMLLKVARRLEAERDDALAKRRASDVARKTAQRERDHVKSRDVRVTPRDSAGPSPHVGERSQVVTPSLPSLRSEELKKPPEKTSSSTPKGAKPRGSKRVPTNWIPGRATLGALEAEGYSPGDLERALTRMRDHEFRTPRSDWDAAYRNWVRSDADRKPRHERPHHDPKFEARQANLAAHERGADLAARLRRES